MLIVIWLFFDVKKSIDKVNFDLYQEDHTTSKKGEVTLYEYRDDNYCFSDEEKQMISNRLSVIDVFDNELFDVDKCGSRIISFSVNDYDSFGNIILYSKSSFEKIKQWFQDNYSEGNIKFFNSGFFISDDHGDIQVYKEGDGFKIIYVTSLPYKYMISEIDNYSTFKKYFLRLNLEKNDLE